jgi:uncharacterized protein
MIRAVLDTNVYVSALLRPEGPPGEILRLALVGAFRVVTTAAIREELRRALEYSRVRKRIRPPTDVAAWLQAVEFVSDVVRDREGMPQVCSDPDDDKFLWAAHEGSAEFVVSGDGALLDVGEHEGVRVVTPVTFLRVLS